jgi:Arc/MetJ family transcription regulator
MANVKRTTINLDLDLVQEAAAVLGTARTTDTVHAAMRDSVRRRKLERLARRGFPDLSLEALERMREPRAFEPGE